MMTTNEATQTGIVQGGFARIDEACKFLGISRSSCYKLMDAGQLAYAKIGGARRIPWRALHEYAASCMVGAN